MKIFILFLFINADSPAITVQEFNSKELCETAGKVSEKQWSNWTHPVTWACVEK